MSSNEAIKIDDIAVGGFSRVLAHVFPDEKVGATKYLKATTALGGPCDAVTTYRVGSRDSWDSDTVVRDFSYLAEAVDYYNGLWEEKTVERENAAGKEVLLSGTASARGTGRVGR